MKYKYKHFHPHSAVHHIRLHPSSADQMPRNASAAHLIPQTVTSITRPISDTFLPFQPPLKAFQYLRIFSSCLIPKAFMYAAIPFNSKPSSLVIRNHFKSSSCGSSSLRIRLPLLQSSLVLPALSRVSSLGSSSAKH